MTGAVICAPMAVERLALRTAATPVVRTGMGPDRSRSAAARLAGRPVLVAGVGGGLAPHVRAGDVVVATEVRGPDGERVTCAQADRLAVNLRRCGLTVHLGPVVSSRRVVFGAARRALTDAGVPADAAGMAGAAAMIEAAAMAGVTPIAVDTESIWLAPGGGEPYAVVRVITDTARQRLASPAIVVRGIRALARLRRAVPALDTWAALVRVPVDLHFSLPKEVG
jgi:4-hydroxy-3-methylbut-2-en-1-yl diphosphate reductase